LLYNYGQDIYKLKKVITNASLVIGVLALVIVYLGLFSPVGKFTLLQTLTVIQVAYFSAFQFEQLPITFEGLKNLGFSNGFNLNLNLNPTSSILDKDIYPFMGLGSTSLFSNYNVSFFVLCLIPFAVGLASLIILRIYPSIDKKSRRIYSETSSQQSSISLQSFTAQDKNKLVRALFERVFYEWTIYGLIVGGNLVWISLFYCIKEKGSNAGNFIYGAVVLIFWITYIVFLMKIET
jgi:hypothetical protein